jgi:hypothetical protein
MAESDDEGASLAEFMGMFTRETFAKPEHTRARLKAERRAGLTQKQRAKRGETKKQVNFRADNATRALIGRLSAHHQLDKTAILLLAINKLAEATLGDPK